MNREAWTVKDKRGNIMKMRQSAMKGKWYPALTGILSITTLGISLSLLRTLMAVFGDEPVMEKAVLNINYTDLRPIACVLFLFLALFHLIQGIFCFRKSRLLFFKQLIYILFCVYSCILVFRKGDDLKIWPTACLLYMLAVFIGCVLSLIRKRSKWNVLLLVLILVVLFFGGCARLVIDFGEPDQQGMGAMLAVILLFLLVDVQGIASIVPLAFSSIRMDILQKIIRKTYAMEILFGIVLLIVAFSFVLPAFEPGIDNFGDALWYCFAIVTTIGFGDITALSAVGRIMSVILGLYGIIVVSLITSIIVNFYGEMKKEEEKEAGAEDGTGDGQAVDEAKKRPEGRKPEDRKTGGENDVENAVILEEIEL